MGKRGVNNIEAVAQLESLIAPMSLLEFRRDYLGKKSVYFPGMGKRDFAAWFGFRELEDHFSFSAQSVGEMSFRMNFRRLELADSNYKDGEGGVDFEKVTHMYQGGATLIMPSVQKFSNRILRLNQNLEAAVGGRFNANFYATPPNSFGFGAHYDRHDVFILQLEGRKQWHLYRNDAELPLERMAQDSKPDISGGPKRSVVLEAGDLLYVPRGAVHAAMSMKSEPSLHITIGFRPLTWGELIENSWMELTENQVALREVVPPEMLLGHANVDAISEQLRAHVQQFSSSLNAKDGLRRFHCEHSNIGGTEHELVVPPTDYRRIVASGARFRKNPDPELKIEHKRDETVLTLPWRSSCIRLNALVKPWIEFLESHRDFSPFELPRGDLDADPQSFFCYLWNTGIIEPVDKL